ncbi:pentapeptide repeat protein (plasmid) [Calothrix sp. NIES-4071]|nr:pentapeptide repeat protein [Calothrix sp. NIES-4071]BAZ65066.1 pentapeptide repeat protein [Calothrix sp. NIES-4105]
MIASDLLVLYKRIKPIYKFYFLLFLIIFTVFKNYAYILAALIIGASTIAVLFTLWTRSKTNFKAQHIIFESYLERMSQILMREKCYPKHRRKNLELTDTVIKFIITDTSNILEQLQGNSNFQNYALNYLRSFEIQTEVNYVVLNNLNLKYLKFDDFAFDSTSFNSSNLENASFKQAYFDSCDLGSANLQNASFAYASIRVSDFTNAKLKNASFEEAKLTNTDFSGADLTNANFKAARLAGVNISHAKMYGVKNLTVEQVLQTRNWKLAYFDIDFKRHLKNYFSNNNSTDKNKDKPIINKIFYAKLVYASLLSLLLTIYILNYLSPKNINNFNYSFAENINKCLSSSRKFIAEIDKDAWVCVNKPDNTKNIWFFVTRLNVEGKISSLITAKYLDRADANIYEKLVSIDDYKSNDEVMFYMGRRRFRGWITSPRPYLIKKHKKDIDAILKAMDNYEKKPVQNIQTAPDNTGI